jgi:hypothetical protein
LLSNLNNFPRLPQKKKKNTWENKFVSSQLPTREEGRRRLQHCKGRMGLRWFQTMIC